MEKLLPKNHPRFCAQYVEFVGFCETPRKHKWAAMTLNNETFEFSQYSTADLKVGQEVYIAKMIPTPRGVPYKWSIHKVILAENYWFYTYHHGDRLTDKQRRMHPYEPRVEVWFGSFTNLITKTSKKR